MQTMTLKLKRDTGWQVIKLPPLDEITAKLLTTWQGKQVVLEWQDVHRKIYAYGDESMKHLLPADCALMDWQSFCHYWQYKLLEIGIDTFTKMEMAEERRAIMEVEKVPEAEIQAHLDSRPDLYEQPEIWPDDF